MSTTEYPVPESLGLDNPDSRHRVFQELTEFVDKTEFGTPEYGAVSDYFVLQELHSSLVTERQAVLNTKDKPDDHLTAESKLRITEMKIALLENGINHEKSRVEGYSRAYDVVDSGFKNLAHQITLDAAQLIPAEEEAQKQIAWGKEAYNQAFSKIKAAFIGKSD